jgi:hypothetical protein
MPATLEVFGSFGRVGKQAKPPARGTGACGFDSHPGYCPFTLDHVPWSNGRAPGLHPGDGGSIPSGMTDGRLVQREDAWPATRRSGFDSPAGPLSLTFMEGSRIRFAGPHR